MNEKSDHIIKGLSELKKYIEARNLIAPEKITIDTSIENDLGLTGDDAVDFIHDFSKTFHVSIENFQFQKYFRPEGTSLLSTLFGNQKPSKIEDMKLKHLVDAIVKGRLE